MDAELVEVAEEALVRDGVDGFFDLVTAGPALGGLSEADEAELLAVIDERIGVAAA